MDSNKPNRRSFFKATGMTVGATTISNIMPSSVLGANDRINFGVIGTGGMGTSHLNSLVNRSSEDNIKVVSVSDVYQRRLNRATGICGGDGYIDYRELLDRDDIDAVVIATPDHWHAKMSLEAMDSGKHVYCEKPFTHTIDEALEVRDAVKANNMVLQVGPQRTAEDQYWIARREIAAGKIGKATWAQGSFNRNVRGGAFNVWFPLEETAGPRMPGEDFVDWDMWLGHKWGLQPRIPWNPEHFFRFRKYFQYNGGLATDLLYHYLAPLQLAIAGENGEYPHRVTAGGGLYIFNDGRDIPDVCMITVDYASGFSVFLVSAVTNNTQLPTRIYGQYGTIEFPEGGNATYTSNGDYKPEFRENYDNYDEVTIVSENTRDMEGNFIDVIRQGGTLYCNAELGATTMIAIKMGSMAYQRNKALLWDPENERVVEG